MKHPILFTLALTLLAAPLLAAPPTPEQLEKIKTALPADAPAKPQKARKILLFSKTAGFRHSSIEVGAASLKLLGEKTGAFTADHTEDEAKLTADNLKQYDALVFLNTTGSFFTGDDKKAALLDFVKSGKGLVGIHSATDCFYDWPEYGQLMGGYFDGHPWHEKVTLKIDDPNHPLAKPFAGKPFEVVDEIYQFKPEPYSRATLHLLTSLDVTKTSMANKEGAPRGNRGKEGDYAVSWVRSYGNGRVFYCSLGHREEIYWNPTILQHYLAGIQFALGDLKADAAPSEPKKTSSIDLPLPLGEALRAPSRMGGNENSPAFQRWVSVFDVFLRVPSGTIETLPDTLSTVPTGLHTPAASFPTVETVGYFHTTPAGVKATPSCDCADDLSSQLKTYKAGENPELPKSLSDKISAASDAPAKLALEKELLAALPIASPDGKQLLCRHLSSIGSDASIPALAALISDASPPVREAAITALGKLATPAAAKAIAAALPKADEQTKPLLADGYLSIADRWLEEDATKSQAGAIYKELFNSDAPPHIRTVALRGLAASDPAGGGIKILSDQLGGNDEEMKVAAVRILQETKGAQATAALTAALGNPSPSVQTAVAQALAARGDKSAGPAVAKLAETSKDEKTRIASVKTLAKIGDASTVPLLATIAAESKGELRNTARTSLATLRGKDVNAKIVETLQLARGGEKSTSAVELIRALGERQADETIDVIIHFAINDRKEPALNKEAFRVLGDLAPAEKYNTFVEAIGVTPADASVLAVAEKAIVTASTRVKEPEQRVAPVIATHATAKGETRAALLRVLSALGGEKALTAVRSDLASTDPVVKEAAARALASWPDDSAAPDLLKLAKESDQPNTKILALRGYIRLAGSSLAPRENTGGTPVSSPGAKTRPASDTLAMYKHALELATRPEEKRLILAGLSDLPTEDSLKLAQTLLPDPALKTESEQAVKKIQEGMKHQ